MKRFFTSFLFCFSLFLIHHTSYSQWTQCKGIYGGSLITSISADNNRIIVGTFTRGVFFSDDKGKNWIEKNNGLSKKEISSILVKNNNVFVGTYQDGLYKSSDNGNSWHYVTSKWTSPTKIVSIGETIFVNSYMTGVLRSNDDGITWDTVAREFAEESILDIKTNGKNLYFNSFGDIYKSSDKGKTWQQILKDGSSFPPINFAVEEEQIFIHTKQGFFLSTDEGKTWNEIINTDYRLYDSEFVSIINGVLYVGTEETLYKVSNGGFRWKPLTQSMKDFSGVSRLMEHGSKLYIGTTRGLYESTNIDTNWLPLGPSAHKVNTIAKKGEAIYAGTDNGLFVSNDKGEHWQLTHKWAFQEFNNNSLQFKDICLADTTLIASTDLGICTIETDGIIDKFINQTQGILALGYQENVIYISIEDNVGLRKSTDNGVTWQTTGMKNGSFDILYCNSGKVFIAGRGTIFFSDDKAETWNQISTPQEIDSKVIYGICTLNNIIFLATQVGVFYSNNNGETWQTPITTLPSVSITSIMESRGIIYIGHSQGVHYSTDEGVSWSQLGSKFSIKSISTMYSDDSTLYVGTFGESMWKHRKDILQTISPESNHTSSKHISCYPNPSSESFSLSVNSEQLIGSRCEILTLEGKVIHSFGIVSDTTPIFVSTLDAGMYLLCIRTNTKVYTAPLHIIH